MLKRKIPLKFRIDLFLLITYLLLSGLMLSFSSGGFIVNFKDIGFSMMSSTQRGVYSIASFFTGTFTAIRELSDLKKKYNDLSIRLKDYELLQRSNADIHIENERLKELLKFSEGLTIRNIPAEIIGRDPNNLYSGITINRGSRHGIKKNMPVISFQGSNTGLVGKIVQVGRNTSLIMPVYDYQSFISARLETSRYEGLVNGQGDSDASLTMKYVQKRAKEEIKIGDKIITSGETNNFPKNLTIGLVSRIKGLDYETSLELDLEPIIDFSRLEEVFILDMASPSMEDNVWEK